jgi:hypothetical protein
MLIQMLTKLSLPVMYRSADSSLPDLSGKDDSPGGEVFFDVSRTVGYRKQISDEHMADELALRRWNCCAVYVGILEVWPVLCLRCVRFGQYFSHTFAGL